MTEIDATGKVVTPGFIDIHSHSDFTLLVDPRAASAVHQGVTLEVVGNCGFGCFPLLDKELAPKAIYGHSADVPLTWTRLPGYFERLEEAAPGDQRAQPRAERPDQAVGGRARGPPGAPGRADEDALPARRGARAGCLGLLDRARVRGRAGSRRGRARLDVCGLRPPARDLRHAHAAARRGRGRAPSRRRCARPSARGCGCRSPISSRATASNRRDAASSSSTTRRRAGWTSPSTCTRASTGRPSCSRPCHRGRSRIRRGCARLLE